MNPRVTAFSKHRGTCCERHECLLSRRQYEFDAGVGNDNSVYGVENAWPEVCAFSQDPALVRLANEYMQSVRQMLSQRQRPREDEQLIEHLLSQGRQRGSFEVFDDRVDPYESWMVKLTALRHRPGKLDNSGGDWHRDSLFPGIKSMLFLTDVSLRSGPLQLFPASRYYLDDHVFCTRDALLSMKQQANTKYSDSSIRASFPDVEPVELTVSRGSLVLFDTSLVHRGKPIQEGERWALSSYMFKGPPDLANLHWFNYNRWQDNYIEPSAASC